MRQRKLGNVKARLSGWMLVGSAPMALAGVAVAGWLEARYGSGVDSVQGRLLGGVLLAGGLGLLAKSIVRYRETDDSFRLTNRDRLVALAIGLSGGFVVGLTSVGSGVFFALTLLLAFPLRSAKVVGTDIFHAAALLWIAGLGHLASGNVDLAAVAWLLAGSIPGVLIGSQFTVKLPERILRAVLASILALSGLKLLDAPAGALLLALVLLPVVAALALVWRIGKPPKRGEAAIAP